MQKDSPADKARPQRDSQPLIYLVDDEPVLLELAATLLADVPCRVESFSDAESALQAFTAANPRPALIITDFAMHRMNGMELIEECRRLQPRQKIILTSGTVDESVYRSLPVKPDRFLAKPYLVKEFIEMVESTLAG